MSMLSCSVPPQSEKLKVANLTRKEKKSYAEIAKIYGNTNFSNEILNKEKDIHNNFVTIHQTKELKVW